MADRDVATGGGVRIGVLAQYVKDLSFENPNAPGILGPRQVAPSIHIDVQITTTQLSATDREVALKLDGKAVEGPDLLFAFEVVYAGVFRLEGIPDNQVQRTLVVDCAHLLFPFVRQIVAETVRDGGFPPLYVDPIDFAGIHAAKKVSPRK